MRRGWSLPSGLFRQERGVGEMMDRRSVRQTPPACVAGAPLVERRYYANFAGEKLSYLNMVEFPFSPFRGTDGAKFQNSPWIAQFLNRIKFKSFFGTESNLKVSLESNRTELDRKYSNYFKINYYFHSKLN